MKAYQYDKDGYYSKEVECQLDPRASFKAGKEVYLQPISSTFLEPPTPPSGFRTKFNGNEWIFEAIPEPEPTPEEVAEDEIWELKGKLAASDYAIIKIAEGAATREEYADLITQRAEWRARINELEAAE